MSVGIEVSVVFLVEVDVVARQAKNAIHASLLWNQDLRHLYTLASAL